MLTLPLTCFASQSTSSVWAVLFTPLFSIVSFLCVCAPAQLCLTLCDPMDCNPPGSLVHRIFQARILEWVAIFFSRESSQSWDWTWVFYGLLHCQANSLYHCTTWDVFPVDDFKIISPALTSCLISPLVFPIVFWQFTLKAVKNWAHYPRI